MMNRDTAILLGTAECEQPPYLSLSIRLSQKSQQENATEITPSVMKGAKGESKTT